MPYYHRRWHMFNEQERREFGQRMRAQASKEWHSKWISKQRLKSDRLWTDKAILEFLGSPREAGPIKAWLLEDVLAAEKTKEFKAWMQKRRAWLESAAIRDTRKVISRARGK